MSENIFADLNQEQLAAVLELDNNVLLSAGAGTGKTKTMISRIMNIIASGKAIPEEILCLTFTNKACKEVVNRIEATMPQEAKAITAKTIHGFGYYLYNETVKTSTPGFEPYLIYDDEDQLTILEDICAEHKLQFHKNTARNIVEGCKQIRYEENFISGNNYQDFTHAIDYALEIKHQPLANYVQSYTKEKMLKLVVEYQKYLDLAHGLDFKDLVGKPLVLLRNPEHLAHWQNKYKYIMIDEFQDTSTFEYAMLLPLLQGKNVFLAGDLFQTIYSWRGSQPEIIKDKFMEEFQPRVIHLRENYRSSKILLEMAYQTMQNLFTPEKINNSYAKNLISKSNIRGHKIPLKGAANVDQEAKWIVTKILKILPTIQSSTDIAILTRDNRSCRELIPHLEYYTNLAKEHNPYLQLRFTDIEEYKFFKKKEIKDVISVFKYAVNPLEILSLKRILLNLIPGVGRRTLDLFKTEEFRQLGLNIDDFLTANGTDKYQDLIEGYHHRDIVVFDVEATGTDVLSDYVIQLSALKIRDGKVVEVFDKYVKAPIPVGSSEAVHHISDDYLAAHGLEPEDVYRDFLAFSENCILAGHNILSFDINILRTNLQRCQLEFKPHLCFDTLELVRKFYPHTKNHKLEYLSQLFNFNTKSSHNALEDVKANWELLEKVILEKLIPLAPQRQAKLAQYGQRFAPAVVAMNAVQTAIHDNKSVEDILATIVNDFHLKAVYKAGEQATGAKMISNIRKLYKVIREKIKNQGADGVLELIQFATLSNNIDLISDDYPTIPVITVHQAKGLEFNYEFLANLSFNRFPSLRSEGDQLNEEKRLFYVAITRAKKELFISYIDSPSPFIATMPAALLEKE